MKYNCKTAKELLKKVKNEDIKMVDLRFTDLPGSTHNISIPIRYLKEDLFVDGVGFDGSSVRGFQIFFRFFCYVSRIFFIAFITYRVDNITVKRNCFF